MDSPTPTGSYRDAVESAPDLADLRIGYSPDFGDFCRLQVGLGNG